MVGVHCTEMSQDSISPVFSVCVIDMVFSESKINLGLVRASLGLDRAI